MAKAYETDLCWFILDDDITDTFFGVCSSGDLHTLQRFLRNPQAMRHLRCYIEQNDKQDYPTFWLDALVTCLARKRGKTAAARERRTRMAQLMREQLMHLNDEELSTQARALFEASIDTEYDEREPCYDQPYVNVVQQLLEWRVFTQDDAQKANAFVYDMLIRRRRKAAAAEAPPA